MITPKRHAFAMVANAKYLRGLETLLKSIYANVPNATCYVANIDLPAQWFKQVRRKVAPFGGQIVDCRFLEGEFDQYPDIVGVPSLTYARFLLPDRVAEDRVLYLDVDTLVTRDVSGLFATDLGENVLAAANNVTSIDGELKNEFNSGVMLIDCVRWRNEGLSSKLFSWMDEHKDEIKFADQQVLNDYFAGHFTTIDKTYNLMIGQDQWATAYKIPGYDQVSVEPYPAIAHYIGPQKPWKYDSAVRLIDLWWDYSTLEWTEIQAKWHNHMAMPTKPAPRTRPLLLTLTESAAIETLEDLAKALPECDFVVAAYTVVAPELARLRQYTNVSIIALVNPPLLAEYLKQTDLYLDINYGSRPGLEFDGQGFGVREWAHAYQVPVLQYDDNNDELGDEVLPAGDYQAMAATVRRLLKERG